MPPYIKNFGSEPKLTPEDNWIKFCEFMYLTQGVVAEKEVNFDSEKKIQRMPEKLLIITGEIDMKRMSQ